MQAALIMEGGYFMATTRLMPLHTGKGRTVGTAISDIIDYVQNPQKTDNGRLITSYQCDSRIADSTMKPSVTASRLSAWPAVRALRRSCPWRKAWWIRMSPMT